MKFAVRIDECVTAEYVDGTITLWALDGPHKDVIDLTHDSLTRLNNFMSDVYAELSRQKDAADAMQPDLPGISTRSVGPDGCGQ